MKLKPEHRVTYDVAKAAALTAMDTAIYPVPASWVAQFIWPYHQMKAQGAGAAASRILKRMEKEGLCRWATMGHGIGRTWGWVLGSPSGQHPADCPCDTCKCAKAVSPAAVVENGRPHPWERNGSASIKGNKHG